VILDLFQWDVFQHFYHKSRIDFATFFLNSTAHFQHAYWRHMEPERFSVKPSKEEIDQYGGAILFGYKMMDELIRRFLKLAGQDGTLIFCTGLSQQQYLKREAAGGRHYYRIHGSHVFRERLGIEAKFEYNPVMSDQVILRFVGEDEALKAEEHLRSYQLFDKSAFHMSLEGADLIVQCNFGGVVPPDTMLTQELSGRQVPFFDIFYSMDVVKSGYHHPDGMLWVRFPDGVHAVHQKKVSLRSIAPAVLEHFGVPRPDFMTFDSFLQGSSSERRRSEAVPEASVLGSAV
jgi:hypothetical protein